MQLLGIEILTPGQRLKALRKQFGLKQEDLESKNLSKNYISMFENDKRRKTCTLKTEHRKDHSN